MSGEHHLHQALADLAERAPAPLRGVDELVDEFRDRIRTRRRSLGLAVAAVVIAVAVVRRTVRARCDTGR